MPWNLATRWGAQVALLIVVMVGAACLSTCEPEGRGARGPANDSAAAVAVADSDSVRSAITEGPLGAEPEADSAKAMTALIRAYYGAINERRYADAYRLWGSQGAASHQSFDAFRSGFSETASVSATPGTPGPMEGAAGSRFVEVPVRVTATLKSGTLQEFAGSYTLRRSVVDGATTDQRAWRIYTAKLRQVR